MQFGTARSLLNIWRRFKYRTKLKKVYISNIFQAMGSSTGVRHERQEVSSTDSPRVEGLSPVRGSFFFAEFICSNTILADLPE